MVLREYKISLIVFFPKKFIQNTIKYSKPESYLIKKPQFKYSF